jgi:membrane protease YdiL (CAAX protease family)
MVKRILIIWLIANFVIVGLASAIRGMWYDGWTHNIVAGMFIQLGLVMLPNLVLPILLLRFWWTEPVGSLRDALGWRWHGWRTVLAGLAGFVLVILISILTVALIGNSIPYSLPGVQGIHANNLLEALGILLLLLVFFGLTVTAEETMFRGLMQTQFAKYGFWVSLLLPALLFGLRHLPEDIFFGHLWQATPQMWLTRQLQLYATALLLGLARHFGRSTYASAIVHTLIFTLTLFG